MKSHFGDVAPLVERFLTLCAAAIQCRRASVRAVSPDYFAAV
jgi:hypothetical protein